MLFKRLENKGEGGEQGRLQPKKNRGAVLTRDTLRCILNFTKNRFYWVYWII